MLPPRGRPCPPRGAVALRRARGGLLLEHALAGAQGLFRDREEARGEVVLEGRSRCAKNVTHTLYSRASSRRRRRPSPRTCRPGPCGRASPSTSRTRGRRDLRVIPVRPRRRPRRRRRRGAGDGEFARSRRVRGDGVTVPSTPSTRRRQHKNPRTPRRTRHVVAAVVLRDRLLALRAGLGLAALPLATHHLVKFLVGLRVLDRPLVVLFLVRLPCGLLLHHISAVAVVRRADLWDSNGEAASRQCGRRRRAFPPTSGQPRQNAPWHFWQMWSVPLVACGS